MFLQSYSDNFLKAASDKRLYSSYPRWGWGKWCCLLPNPRMHVRGMGMAALGQEEGFCLGFHANISVGVSSQAGSCTRGNRRPNTGSWRWSLDGQPEVSHVMGVYDSRVHLRHYVAMSLGLSEQITQYSKSTLVWVSPGLPVASRRRQRLCMAPVCFPSPDACIFSVAQQGDLNLELHQHLLQHKQNQGSC